MKIFLSSTHTDLVAYREAVTEAIRRLGHEVKQMEIFGARPEDPVTACLEQIDESDLFLGIYAHRYGHIPNTGDSSITELEFHHARQREMPILCFVVQDDYPWPPTLIDSEPNLSKLRAFLGDLQQLVVVERFGSPEDLASKATASVARHISMLSRGDRLNSDNPDLLKEILSELQQLRAHVTGDGEREHASRAYQLITDSASRANLLDAPTAVVPRRISGWWHDSISSSTFYVRSIGQNSILVPYSFRGSDSLSGIFYDLQTVGPEIFIGRFKWFDVPIWGYVYIEYWESDHAAGGWWYAHDVPRNVLRDVRKLRPGLPMMNTLQLGRSAMPARIPEWVVKFLQLPTGQLLSHLEDS